MNHRLFHGAIALIAASATVSFPSFAQNISAHHRVYGVINDTLGNPLAGVVVQLKTASGRVIQRMQTNAQGQFDFENIVEGTYSVEANKSSFQKGVSAVVVTQGNDHAIPITLAANEALDVKIVAHRLNRARNTISVETGSSLYRVGKNEIAALPQGEDTPFNQVLLRAPGVAEDSYGQLHVRGDHGNLQYRLNGIILPESISGFGQTLDTRFIQNINFLTGALPAQYGYRTAGVVDIHTKNGLESGGNIGIQVGSHNTQEVNGDLMGSKNGFSYYVTGSLLKNNVGIENPTADFSAIHDTTHQHKEFGYFSYLLSPTSRVSLILGNADNHFEIPNNPNQTPVYHYNGVNNYPSAHLDEKQHEVTRYGVLAYQGVIGDKLNYQVAAFSRYSKVLYEPDTIGDLIYTGVAGRILRTGQANGLQADGSYSLNKAHTLRAGLFYTREGLSNYNNALTFPCCDTNGNQTSDTPVAIDDVSGKVTHETGIYLQDEWKLNPKLTLNYGVRADWLNAYVTDHQLSPRVGLVYQMSPVTTVHAGYARYFTPPANELIADATITQFQNTTNAAPGTQNDPVQAEKTDYYDLGLTHKLTPYLTLGLDSYYKKVKNLLDEGQFGSALLFTPFNYQDGKIYGAEFTVNYQKDNVSAYMNIARSVALGKNIISSQYTFDSNESNYIANHWVHLDHDQAITASTGASYLWQGTLYSADALFGSGLRNDFANTGHLAAYTTVNLSASHTFNSSPVGKFTGRLSAINLFDRVYELRDGSGIGVGAPQFGQRRSMYLSLNKSF